MTDINETVSTGWTGKFDALAAMREYEKREAELLATPITEITSREWHHQLNQLPPLNWCNHDGLNMFLCCEAMYGEIHSQYVKCGIRYFHLYADRIKRGTWCTMDRIDAVRDTAKKSAELIVETIMNDASGSWETRYIGTKPEAIMWQLYEAGYLK